MLQLSEPLRGFVLGMPETVRWLKPQTDPHPIMSGEYIENSINSIITIRPTRNLRMTAR